MTGRNLKFDNTAFWRFKDGRRKETVAQSRIEDLIEHASIVVLGARDLYDQRGMWDCRGVQKQAWMIMNLH